MVKSLIGGLVKGFTCTGDDAIDSLEIKGTKVKFIEGIGV